MWPGAVFAGELETVGWSLLYPRVSTVWLLVVMGKEVFTHSLTEMFAMCPEPPKSAGMDSTSPLPTLERRKHTRRSGSSQTWPRAAGHVLTLTTALAAAV